MTERQKSETMYLTRGRPLVQIALFALPLVLGTLFQQLYSFADTVMVGRFLGTDALAAVGAVYSLNFLVLGFVQGACVGFSIPLAQRFGAGDTEGLHRFLWNGWWVCAILAALLTAATLWLVRPMLALMSTPESILEDCVVYASIIFAGIPATMVYNFSAGALRSVGDSKHPFCFLLITSLLNILLDFLFLVPFGWGVAGAALASVISQGVSGVLNLRQLYFRTRGIRLRRQDLTPSPAHMGRLCAVGLPMGLEYSVSAIGAVVMQNAINALGTSVVAAQTAAEKIRQMCTLPMESVGMAMATYAGQNLGAGRMDRIRRGIRDGLLLQGLYCAGVWVLLLFVRRPAVALVLGEADAGIYADALLYLTIISALFLLHGGLMIFRNTLQGMGHSTLAVLSGLGELLGRGICSVLSVSVGFVAICYANPAAWGISLCFCAGAVWRYVRKEI